MIDTRTAAYGALLLRVGLGVLALAHGLLKVLVFTVPGTVGFFEQIGYPGWFAYLVIGAEIAGGLALIAGVYVRAVALALVPVLIGATLQHVPNGWQRGPLPPTQNGMDRYGPGTGTFRRCGRMASTLPILN